MSFTPEVSDCGTVFKVLCKQISEIMSTPPQIYTKHVVIDTHQKRTLDRLKKEMESEAQLVLILKEYGYPPLSAQTISEFVYDSATSVLEPLRIELVTEDHLDMVKHITTYSPTYRARSRRSRSMTKGDDTADAHNAFAATVLFATATPNTLKWSKCELSENDELSFKVSPRVDDGHMYSTWTYTKGGYLEIKQHKSFMGKYPHFIKYTMRRGSGPGKGIRGRSWRMTWFVPNPPLNQEILDEYYEEEQVKEESPCEQPQKRRKLC